MEIYKNVRVIQKFYQTTTNIQTLKYLPSIIHFKMQLYSFNRICADYYLNAVQVVLSHHLVQAQWYMYAGVFVFSPAT